MEPTNQRLSQILYVHILPFLANNSAVVLSHYMGD